jgi:hypothetical protein
MLSGLVSATLATATQAATCAAPTSGVVFVGTLTSADDTSGRATFAVEDVWSGGDVPAVVEVAGSPGQWNRQPPDARYLVLATVVGGKLDLRSECSHALPWDESMAAERPATAHPPTTGTTDSGVPYQLLVVVGVVLLIGAVSAFAFRRTRAPA